MGLTITVSPSYSSSTIPTQEEADVYFAKAIEKIDKDFADAAKDMAKDLMYKFRREDDYTLEDFKAVIDYKVSKWKGTDMEQYLRPSTLFGNKFQNYVNEIPNRSIESTKTVKEDTPEFTNFMDLVLKGGLEDEQ